MSRAFKPRPAPLAVGDILPAACDAHDVARAFGISLNTVYDWKKNGTLRKFELPKPYGSKRWSGRLILLDLDGGRKFGLVTKAS